MSKKYGRCNRYQALRRGDFTDIHLTDIINTQTPEIFLDKNQSNDMLRNVRRQAAAIFKLDTGTIILEAACPTVLIVPKPRHKLYTFERHCMWKYNLINPTSDVDFAEFHVRSEAGPDIYLSRSV